MPTLHDAIDPETARVLLAGGANVHAIDADGLTPLYCAALRNDTSLIAIYLASGARPSQWCGNSKRAMDVASHPEAVALLAQAAVSQQGAPSLLIRNAPLNNPPRNTPATNQKDPQPQEKHHG